MDDHDSFRSPIHQNMMYLHGLCVISCLLALLPCSVHADDANDSPALDYAPTDAALKAVRIDHDERESFLGMACDAAGRLFVGGREALFVYAPDDASQTGYGPRREVYRFPDHTWIYDVAVRGHDVYVLTVSALYLLPDAARPSALPGNDAETAAADRPAIVPRRLVWGVPLGHVHQCFHGMAIGPEGDIYFAMGDPLWYYGDFNRPDHWGHWTMFCQPEGTRVPYTGVGGVFRCRPDGSELRVVARGLRNPCGLCFDSHWNLFSNDNDHEGLPYQYVPGRLIHVTPHAHFSWPTGWMLSKTPDRADLLETMYDGLGRAVPVGQAYYDDTFLPGRLRNNLLVARWCTRAVTNYPLEERGASFRATEEQTLLAGRDLARPVSVCVGRGGRIFVSVAYMAHNEGSPTYPSDVVMITRADDAAPYPFERYEATEASNLVLLGELSDPSWSRRYQAHVEIIRRGGEALNYVANRLPQVRDDDLGRECMVWLAATQGGDKAREWLQTKSQESATDPSVRRQAVRAVAQSTRAWGTGGVYLGRALHDPDPAVQLAALCGMFDKYNFGDRGRIVELAGSTDTYLRQAAALLLVEKATPKELREMCQADDAPTRLAGVLAVGFKLTLPPATEEIPYVFPLQETRGYEVTYADGQTVDLRMHGRIGNFTVAEHWNARKQPDLREPLFDLLLPRLDDTDEAVRLQAAHFLSLLNDPRSEPGVQRVRADTDDRRLSTAPLKPVDPLWLIGPFADGGQGFDRAHPPETGPVDVAASYIDGDRQLAWHQASPVSSMFDLAGEGAGTDEASWYGCFRLETAARQRVHLLVGSDDGIKVWLNGRVAWTNDVNRGALPFQDVVPLDLEAGGNDLLIRVRNISGAAGLYAHFRSLQPLVLSLPERLDADELTARLKASADAPEGQKVPPEFLSVDWRAAAAQGDAARGKKLFETIGCGKCHAITPDAVATGGPSLVDAARRFTVPYLVESVLLPSKQLSPIFRATGIITTDGRQLTGLVVGETAEKVELLQLDAKRVSIDKSEIEERQLLDQSPMPHGVVKQPDELRDLLAYLLGAS
jgi:putative heme-binding domain-containing protein